MKEKYERGTSNVDGSPAVIVDGDTVLCICPGTNGESAVGHLVELLNALQDISGGVKFLHEARDQHEVVGVLESADIRHRVSYELFQANATKFVSDRGSRLIDVFNNYGYLSGTKSAFGR